MENQYVDHQATFLHIPVISATGKFRTIGELDTLTYTPLDISNFKNEHHTVDQEEIISQDYTSTSEIGRYSQEQNNEASIEDNSPTIPGNTIKVSMI